MDLDRAISKMECKKNEASKSAGYGYDFAKEDYFLFDIAIQAMKIVKARELEKDIDFKTNAVPTSSRWLPRTVQRSCHRLAGYQCANCGRRMLTTPNKCPSCHLPMENGTYSAEDGELE